MTDRGFYQDQICIHLFSKKNVQSLWKFEAKEFHFLFKWSFWKSILNLVLVVGKLYYSVDIKILHYDCTKLCVLLIKFGSKQKLIESSWEKYEWNQKYFFLTRQDFFSQKRNEPVKETCSNYRFKS